jgi:RNA polymerase sigma-70 factor (ECF subfamily)
MSNSEADKTVDPSVALFEQAVESHARRLIAIARGVVGHRASADDIVQQALTNLFEHRHRYDWRQPGGLMRRAVVNEALRVLRRPPMAWMPDEHPGAQQTPVAGMLAGEAIDQVRRAIDQLPEHFRAALVLCEYENLSYAEIAETLGASVPQIKTWIHRARRQLAQLLKQYMSDASDEPASGGRRPDRDAIRTSPRLTRERRSDSSPAGDVDEPGELTGG